MNTDFTQNSIINVNPISYTKKIGSGGYGRVYLIKENSSQPHQEMKTRGRTRQRTFDTDTSLQSENKYVLKRNLCNKSSNHGTQLKECNYLRMLGSFPHFVNLTNISININKENHRDVSPAEDNLKDDLIHFILPKSTDNLNNFHSSVIDDINVLEDCIRKNTQLSEQQYKKFHYPYLHDKTLQENLDNVHTRYFDDVLTCVVHVCLGLEYMNRHNLIHRDIKLQNILYDINPDGTKTFKICDLGFIRKINGRDLSPDKFTPGFHPPETICKNRRYTTKTDVWTVGLCLYMLLRHRPLFSYDNRTDVLKEVVNSIDCTQKDFLEEDYDKYKKYYDMNYSDSKYVFSNIKLSQRLNTSFSERRFKHFLDDFKNRSGTITNLNTYIKNNLFDEICDIDSRTSPPKSIYDETQKYPYTVQIQILLKKMLDVNPRNRFSATDCLEMPLFNKHRDYINKIRETYYKKQSIEIYRRPEYITTKINEWISILQNMKDFYSDFKVIDYITVANIIDCVDRMCYLFHTCKFNVNNPFPIRISKLFNEYKDITSYELDHVISVIVYMILKLHIHDSKLSYSVYHNILSKILRDMPEDNIQKKVLSIKIHSKYISMVELSILHAFDGIMYRDNFLDLSKYSNYKSFAEFCTDYVKYTTHNTENTVFVESFKHQDEYSIVYLSYVDSITHFVDDVKHGSSYNTNIATSKITNTSQKDDRYKQPTLEERALSSIYTKKTTNRSFEAYRNNFMYGITDKRLDALTNKSMKTHDEFIDMEKIKSSRSTGSYTCKELRDRLTSLGINYTTRHSKKQLADMLRDAIGE